MSPTDSASLSDIPTQIRPATTNDSSSEEHVENRGLKNKQICLIMILAVLLIAVVDFTIFFLAQAGKNNREHNNI